MRDATGEHETPGPGPDPGTPGPPLFATRSPDERVAATSPLDPEADGDAEPPARARPVPPHLETRSPGERVPNDRGPGAGAPVDPHEVDDRTEIVDRVARVLPRFELIATYRLRDLARRRRLSTNEFLVLAELLFRPNGLSGAQVADLVGLGSGGTTGILARLAERELVERVPDPADRRQLLATATPAARELLWDDLVGNEVPALLQGLAPRDVRAVSLFVGRATDRGFRRIQAARDRQRRR